jgi:ACT domain
VAARMFECLGRGGINIQLVSTSEIKIAVIIDEKDAERAARLIHTEFGLARLMPATGATQPLSAGELSGSKRRAIRKRTSKV